MANYLGSVRPYFKTGRATDRTTRLGGAGVEVTAQSWKGSVGVHLFERADGELMVWLGMGHGSADAPTDQTIELPFSDLWDHLRALKVAGASYVGK